MKSRNSALLPAASVAPSRIVLIAVLGSTPSVLTETLWALAQETPSVIPDTVVVITTTRGAQVLHAQLLTPLPAHPRQTLWQALRARLLGKIASRQPHLTLEPPVIISVADALTGTTRPLDDIRTPADNSAAAEVILATLRRFTTDADTRVLGLLSGGRKTMGALLHAALSLAGRPGDRLLHVLVNEPFDHPGLSPIFYFPGQPSAKIHRHPDGSSCPHTGARIELADVPLVTLGELVFSRTGQAPATFAALTRVAATALSEAQTLTREISLHYDPPSRMLNLAGHTCTVPAGRPAALCSALWQRACEDQDNLNGTELAQAFEAAGISYPDQRQKSAALSSDNIANALHVLRDTLASAGAPPLLIARLLPRRAPIGFHRPGLRLLA